MKKLIAILLVFATFPGVFFACTPQGERANSTDGSVTVVVTSHTAFDMVRQMTESLPEGVISLVKLGKPGQDMHDFDPTAGDITTLATADLVISVGGSSEKWLTPTLSAAMNRQVARVSMMEACGVGTASGDGHHDHDHADDDACTLSPDDEHVWLSPENGLKIAKAIAEALRAAIEAETYPTDKPDGDGETVLSTETATAAIAALESAAADYTAALGILRDDYLALMAEARRTIIVIADRNPFAYLVHDLGLTCYAAFPGCSSETSASFATQTLLIEKTREFALPYIFVMEGSDNKVAETVAGETGAQILPLDSLQVVTDESKTYLETMQKNLAQLRRALS